MKTVDVLTVMVVLLSSLTSTPLFDTAQTLVSRFLLFSRTRVRASSSLMKRKSKLGAANTIGTKLWLLLLLHDCKSILVLMTRVGRSLCFCPFEASNLAYLKKILMSTTFKRFSSNSNRNAEVEADGVDTDVQPLNRSTISQEFSSNSNRKAEVIMLSSNTYVIMLSSNTEDSVRKKGFYKSYPPPPPPPPPTMF
ncbi:hypothetical protein JHK84_052824 [Glycine max]|nr:hypothetical protein JHK84_052824 [Glycine max]